jgi:hypothetical protein
MKVFEFFGNSRSGHHAVINWFIKNVSGIESEMKWKLDLLGGLGLIYINEANLDTELTLKYIQEHSNHTKILVLSYENAKPQYSILNTKNLYTSSLSINLPTIKQVFDNKRIIIIRDFYNNLASRIKANQGEMVKTRDGLVFQWNVGEKFISVWKEQAKFILENKIDYIKFEDWYTKKEIRQEFLFRMTGQFEMYDNKVKGTKSSFGTHENLNNRHELVEISDEIKKIIKQDNELHYLIGALGYEYREL